MIGYYLLIRVAYSHMEELLDGKKNTQQTWITISNHFNI